MIIKWEYKLLASGEICEQVLNALGALGWDLCAVLADNVLLFKRPKN